MIKSISVRCDKGDLSRVLEICHRYQETEYLTYSTSEKDANIEIGKEHYALNLGVELLDLLFRNQFVNQYLTEEESLKDLNDRLERLSGKVQKYIKKYYKEEDKEEDNEEGFVYLYIISNSNTPISVYIDIMQELESRIAKTLSYNILNEYLLIKVPKNKYKETANHLSSIEKASFWFKGKENLEFMINLLKQRKQEE